MECDPIFTCGPISFSFSFLIFQLLLYLFQYSHVMYSFGAELIKGRMEPSILCFVQHNYGGGVHVTCASSFIFKFFCHSIYFLLLSCLGPTSWHTHAFLSCFTLPHDQSYCTPMWSFPLKLLRCQIHRHFSVCGTDDLFSHCT